MFDLAWSEILLVGIVAALVMGPEEIPEAMRAMARVVRKFRAVGREFRRHLDDILHEVELGELQEKSRIFSKSTHCIDPVINEKPRSARKETDQHADGTGI